MICLEFMDGIPQCFFVCFIVGFCFVLLCFVVFISFSFFSWPKEPGNVWARGLHVWPLVWLSTVMWILESMFEESWCIVPLGNQVIKKENWISELLGIMPALSSFMLNENQKKKKSNQGDVSTWLGIVLLVSIGSEFSLLPITEFTVSMSWLLSTGLLRNKLVLCFKGLSSSFSNESRGSCEK